MSKRTLLIHDLAGYGKVALGAMIPVLSHMGHEVFSLPTALVSNTLDYGKFDILDATQFVKNTMAAWAELGFEFDAISTGFIVSAEETELVTEFCRRRAEQGALIFTDPIMGDEGALYCGVGEETIALMRRLISCADYIVPNYTEAAFIAGIPYRKDGADEGEYRAIIDALRGYGAKSVLITSAILKGGENCVIGYDHKKAEYFKIGFEEIPVRFAGTGDIFSAVFMGRILSGDELKTAAKKAMDCVKAMIEKNIACEDKFKGIPIETCLELLED